jgi:hypothetical protein
LSISKLISIIFLDDIALLMGGWDIVFKSRAKLYLFGCSDCITFLTVGLDVSTIFFFLKSILLSRLDVEYFVLVNLG